MLQRRKTAPLLINASSAVGLGKPRVEQNESALPQIADMKATLREVCVEPTAELLMKTPLGPRLPRLKGREWKSSGLSHIQSFDPSCVCWKNGASISAAQSYAGQYLQDLNRSWTFISASHFRSASAAAPRKASRKWLWSGRRLFHAHNLLFRVRSTSLTSCFSPQGLTD